MLGRPIGFGDMESSITRVVGLELYQMTFPTMRGALDMAPRCGACRNSSTGCGDSFDLVVIASPAASEAPMGVLLSRFVDGNILVLEAGRTRAPVAAELRDSLSSSGGAVVGAVLTRYRSHCRASCDAGCDGHARPRRQQHLSRRSWRAAPN